MNEQPLEEIVMDIMAEPTDMVEQSRIMGEIDTLSTQERRYIVSALKQEEITTYPRNLAYNYQTQEWI